MRVSPSLGCLCFQRSVIRAKVNCAYCLFVFFLGIASRRREDGVATPPPPPHPPLGGIHEGRNARLELERWKFFSPNRRRKVVGLLVVFVVLML